MRLCLDYSYALPFPGGPDMTFSRAILQHTAQLLTAMNSKDDDDDDEGAPADGNQTKR